MVIAGILVTLLGWLVAVASVGFTSSVPGRLVMVLIGIALSLFGIMGMINPAYMKNAVWRKQ